MLWHLEHDKHINFYEQLEAKGKTTPLSAQPPIDQNCAWYLEVFSTLSNSRTQGFEGYNPITLSEIMVYYQLFGAIDSVDDYLAIIQKVDNAYLRFSSEQIKRQKDRENVKAKGKR